MTDEAEACDECGRDAAGACDECGRDEAKMRQQRVSLLS